MKITITVDDALFEKALELASPGTSEPGLIREAPETFIRVQAAKRLMALGGTMPGMRDDAMRR
ncbi:MAG: type II toxin-antitoxin system VapB family antitoxin [Pseudomonas sp.]